MKPLNWLFAICGLPQTPRRNPYAGLPDGELLSKILELTHENNVSGLDYEEIDDALAVVRQRCTAEPNAHPKLKKLHDIREALPEDKRNYWALMVGKLKDGYLDKIWEQDHPPQKLPPPLPLPKCD